MLFLLNIIYMQTMWFTYTRTQKHRDKHTNSTYTHTQRDTVNCIKNNSTDSTCDLMKAIN